MNFYLSILSLIVIITSIFSRNYKFLLVLIFLSLIGNLFSVHLGGIRMKYISLITILVIFTRPWKFIKFKSFLNYELLILLFTWVLFVFIFPWEDPTSFLKPFSQQLEMKALIGFLEFFLI